MHTETDGTDLLLAVEALADGRIKDSPSPSPMEPLTLKIGSVDDLSCRPFDNSSDGGVVAGERARVVAGVDGNDTKDDSDDLEHAPTNTNSCCAMPC